MEYPIRINRYLAQEGYATRKGADELIENGLVFINGKPALLGQKVHKTDVVEVHAPAKEYRYLIYYKPRGVITHSPQEGERDIARELRQNYKITGVFPLGRLDKDSEGLMLLTDDGRITGRLLDPQHAHEREYAVIVDKRVTGQFLKQLVRGVDIEGYRTKPARVERNPKNEYGFRIILTEGKKHQIRRMCAALGYQVKALKRVRILMLSLGKLKPGQFRKLTLREQKTFLNALGL